MKICHITTCHNRYDVRIFEKECISLAEFGYDVTLIVNDLNENEIKNGVKIISLRQISRNRLDRALRIANKAFNKALKIDADIYHIHDPELLRIALKLSKANKKVIYDSHEFTAVQILGKPYLPGWSRNIISNIYRRYEQRVLNSIAGLIMPSTYRGVDYFNEVDAPKIVVGNCPKKELVLEETQDLNEEIKKQIGYAGGISKSRGLVNMVRAANTAGKKLVLIGNVSEKDCEYLEKMQEHGYVDYLGRLPHETAMRELRKCSVGLCLLEDEGQYMNFDNLPTKIYEYMAMGIPVVMSNAPYWVRTLEKYKFGIAVDPHDADAVSDAILEVTKDRDTYRKYAKEGQRAILEGMNWEEDAKRLHRFYETIAKADQDDGRI